MNKIVLNLLRLFTPAKLKIHHPELTLGRLLINTHNARA